MKGCDPSPTKKLQSKRFRLKEVDEYLTSKTCNWCLRGTRGEMENCCTPGCDVHSRAAEAKD